MIKKTEKSALCSTVGKRGGKKEAKYTLNKNKVSINYLFQFL
jgi:hypothetical protein